MPVNETLVNAPTRPYEPVLTTLALITNQYLVQIGIEQVIEAAPHITLVGRADRESVAETLLLRTRPQVVLLDMESGFDSTAMVRVIRGSAVDTKIVMLCRLGGNVPISSHVDAIVLTIQPIVVLIAIIHSLCNTPVPHNRLGEVSTGKAVSLEASQPKTAAPYEAKWPDVVTVREREVIELIAQGLSNKAIATRLHISSITVRHHLTHIFDKLGVNGRQNLLIHAHSSGFVALQHPQPSDPLPS